MQQPAACAPLGGARNLLPIHHDIRADWISEAVSAVAGIADAGTGVNAPGYKCALSRRDKCITQSAVNLLVDRHRRLGKNRVLCRNNERVSEIFTMKNNSAARPSSD